MNSKTLGRIPRRVAFLLVAISLSTVLLGACTQGRTAAPGHSPAVTRTRSTDEAEMIHVPDGEFLMGSTDADRKAAADEKPAHTVYLDAFWSNWSTVAQAHGLEHSRALTTALATATFSSSRSPRRGP